MAKDEARDPFKRIIAKDYVIDSFTFDNLGVPIRTTITDPKLTLKYVCLAHDLVFKTKLFLRTYKPTHDILQITLRVGRMEILLMSNNEFSMVLMKSLPDGFPAKAEPEVTTDYYAESTDDEFGKPKKWFKKKIVRKKKNKAAGEVEKTADVGTEEK